MKNIKRIAICLLLAALMIFCLASCIDGDEARETIESFLEQAEKNDFDAAEKYLHPDRPAELAAFFDNVEKSENVDFSEGVEVVRYTNVRSAYYDSTVDGSVYSTEFDAKIGGVSAEIWIEIVDNDSGYGIYNFEIDIED